jgi:KipI family sensor histidine kinase inhibitor
MPGDWQVRGFCDNVRPMTLKPLGDSAWLVEFPPGSTLDQVMGLVGELGKNRPAGVLDVVSSFDSIAVHFEGDGGLEIRKWVNESISAARPSGKRSGIEHVIPVSYGGADGPDLEKVADLAGLSKEAVIELHCGAEYTVAAVGFSPGFPYLLGLPEQLNIPRRETPRLAVPAGSVAIAGGQAGIYPFTSPGGWHVLGKTGGLLFDPNRVPPALLRPGDRVRFEPVDRTELLMKAATEIPIASNRLIEVIQPGAITTVQDLGRPGYESAGVSPGGAADRKSLRLANLLVGNDEDATALELCLSGPVLKFHSDAMVAWVDGAGRPQRVAAGEVVDFSKLAGGVRAYLAVAGGIQIPKLLGSAATDLRAGFGGFLGRALQAGDRLEFGVASPVPCGSDWHVGRIERASQIELRFLAGVQADWFSNQARRRFCSEIYQVTPRSDRMGARLAGAKLELETPREMVSQPVACGSVQVPPDGQPIVLLAERQTIGGYPQIGHVISVDLPKLATAWPGTRMSFREVDWEEAQELRREEEREMRLLRAGVEMKKVRTTDKGR